MKKQILAFSTLAIGALLGASALSALAAGSWAPPAGTPPGNNADAPINVGASTQTKTGLLGLVNLLVTNLTVATGTPAAGKVLTSIDSAGTVGWATPSGGGSSGLNQLCNTVTTPMGTFAGATTNTVISFLIGGHNICSDSNGCTIKIWKITDSYAAGSEVFTTNFRQASNGAWYSSTGDQNGTNGNSTSDRLTAWDQLLLEDDYNSTSGETSPDAITLRDQSDTRSFAAQVCDF